MVKKKRKGLVNIDILDIIRTFWLVVFALAYLTGAIVFFCMVIFSGYERERNPEQKRFQIGTFVKIVLLFPWYAFLYLLDIIQDANSEGIGILFVIGAIFFYMGDLLAFLGAPSDTYLYILLGSFLFSVPCMGWSLWKDDKRESDKKNSLP